MNNRTKFCLDAIEQVQRALDALPEYQEEEVTKSRAVRMLVPQVLALQSKGYSLVAIAKVISDKGIPVSGMALQKYVSHAKSKVDRRKPRSPRKHGEVGPPSSTTKATQRTARGASVEAISPRTSSERTAMFVPRPDTDDI
jgi:hypothetical protein